MCSQPEEEEERKKMIPVFTVMKNGVILKNIFVINSDHSSSQLNSTTVLENGENSEQETEEILIVGRHPDCNIVLLHPSISRFHLQINSKPSLQKLFVTDLSSVHGTWVSEKKIDPGFHVELIEGDTIRVGSSTRVYRLHWVPLSRAYDIENPFVSPSDLAVIEEKEEEDSAVLEEENEEKLKDESLLATENKHGEEKDKLAALGKAEETYQGMNSMSTENGEIQPVDSILEGIVSLFPDENSGLIKEIPSAPLMPETMVSSVHVEKEELVCSCRNDRELSLKTVGGVILQTLSQLFYECKQSSDFNSAIEAVVEEEKAGVSMARIELEPDVEVCNQCSDYHATIEIALEEEKTDISVERIEQESNVEVCNQSSEYHSAAEAVQEEEKTGISIERVELESDIEVTSSSFPEVDSSAACEILEVAENHSILRKYCSLPVETNNEQANKENQILEPLAALRPLYEEGDQENVTENQNLNILINPQSVCVDDTAATDTLEDKENQNSSMKDYGHSEFKGVCSLVTESVNSSLPLGEVLSELVDGKESQTPQSTFLAIENLENKGSPPIRSEKKSSSCNIWSRRGKPSTPLQLQTSKSRKKNRSVGIDTDVEWENQEDVESKSITRVLFHGLEPMDEEVFTPDKENCVPNSCLRNSKKKGHVEDIQSLKFCRSSSKITFSSSIGPDEDMIASSDKENQTPKVLQQRKSARPSRHQMKLEEDLVLKEKRLERIPLQSLLANSPGKSLSEASVPNAAARSSNSINCTRKKSNSVGDGRRRWTMIADTTSLLNKESRKSLQLLEGLKGTHLVIPRTVIRELDSLKRRGSLFRRTTEAELVLQWIEECMIKTKWWIHVQSSVEDERAIAPTPPASPVSRFSDGSSGFFCGTRSSASLSAYGSLLEIVSPTAEDHLVDYALSYRKMHSDGQLVLLSNDVTLKIKSMAEGLICETPHEFRDNLVNPFSERFLWADSSPRGQTWSVLDDVVLKEQYYRSPSKKSSKGEGAKGLKLILLHNSHYGQFVKTM